MLKEQLEKNSSEYEKKYEDFMVERKGMLEENEVITGKLDQVTKNQKTIEMDISKLNSGINQSLSEINKLEEDHKSNLERADVKLKLMEETLNKRNEKYSVLVKEQQHLTKQIEFNEKSRSECEKRILENGDKLKKRLDDLNRSNNINYKDTIEML